MIDDSEEVSRARKAQRLTCPCCTLTWASQDILRAHLELMLKSIQRKLNALGERS